MDQANWLASTVEQIGVVFLLIVGLWYIHNELKGFKKLHAEELADMRKSHREERDAANAYIKKALDDMTEEIKIANSERRDTRHLLESIKDFQIMVANSLSTYDKILSQILVILNTTKGGDKIELPKLYDDLSSSLSAHHTSRAEERQKARARERMKEYDRDNQI